MKSFRVFLLSAVVASSLFALAPAPSQAADYWNGYWGWYDGTYLPYYQRYYSYSGPAYSTPAYASPAYGSYYSAPAYGYSSYYGPSYAPYGGAYIGAPGAAVGVYPGASTVRVGPARFGWR